MDLQQFTELMQDLSLALRWHSLPDRMIARMYEIVGFGPLAIPEDDVLTIVGTAMGEPGTTPASVIQALKAAKERHIKSHINPAFAGNIKPFNQMTAAEKASYLAAIAAAKEKYITPLQEARAAGKLPRTEVPGFAALGDLVPEVIR